MAEELQRLVFLDSSVLIEYFRKGKKENSFFYKLIGTNRFNGFLVSGIVKLEIYAGVNEKQKLFWNNLFEDLILRPFDLKNIKDALIIQSELKTGKRKIAIPDLMIAATAKTLDLPLATINESHFADISGLSIITPASL